MNKKLALLIGVDEYGDLPVLTMPSTDVTELGRILGDSHIGGFDDIKSLLNQGRATVETAVEEFFAQRSRDDLLLLYFSGHGIRSDTDGRLYLAQKDTRRERLRSTAVSASFITELMDESRSQRQVLVLDCCHSGAFSKGFKGETSGSVGTRQAFEGNGRGRIVLTASDATQFAWEDNTLIGSPAENSVFTRFLIEGLRTGEADQDGDGIVTVDEWYEFARHRVMASTTKQKPQIWTYKGEGKIELATVPERVLKRAELPHDIQHALESSLPSVRAAVINELERMARGRHRGVSLAATDALRELLDDDSRLVRTTAQNSLQSLEQGQRDGAASAKAEELRREQEAAVKAEQQRQEREAAARAEQERLEQEAATKAEQERLKQEAAAKAEQERIEIVEKAKADRKAWEIAEKAKAERKAREIAERAKAERKAREIAERAKAEREARELAEKVEAEREARELAEKVEAERKALATPEREQIVDGQLPPLPDLSAEGTWLPFSSGAAGLTLLWLWVHRRRGTALILLLFDGLFVGMKSSGLRDAFGWPCVVYWIVTTLYFGGQGSRIAAEVKNYKLVSELRDGERAWTQWGMIFLSIQAFVVLILIVLLLIG